MIPEANAPARLDEQIAFEQARLEHCIRLFSNENSRREVFEKTAQYYLTFITAFLAALFWKIDFLKTLSNLLSTRSAKAAIIWITRASLVLMLFSLFLALISVLECIRVRRYKREFPGNPAHRLFAPDSPYSGGGNEASFLKISALTYITAIEANFEITERKGLWIERTAVCMLIAVFSLFVLLTAMSYLLAS